MIIEGAGGFIAGKISWRHVPVWNFETAEGQLQRASVLVCQFSGFAGLVLILPIHVDSDTNRRGDSR